MSPFRDAVGFVGREEGDAGTGDLRRELGRLEPFRGDVQESELAAVERLQHRFHLARPQRAVQVHRGNAARAKRVNLVLHQRYQRRDHDRHGVQAASRGPGSRGVLTGATRSHTDAHPVGPGASPELYVRFRRH